MAISLLYNTLHVNLNKERNRMESVAAKLYTENEYLAREESAKNKHEFYNGNIVKMPGASYIHNQISANMIAVLVTRLYDSNHTVLSSDMKIHIPRLASFVYPDAVVICEKVELYEGRQDVILNPLLVVEVTSASTKKYDRLLKFSHYKTLPSFKEYVLIEQTQPWVVASYKTAERTWVDTEAFNVESSIYLQSVNCTIDLQRIYHGVNFKK